MDINDEIRIDETAILSVRLGGLMEVLSETDMECELHMDGEGEPAVLGRLGSRLYHFSYMIAGDSEDTFILTVSTLAGEFSSEGEGADYDISKVLLCDGFNRSSEFGYAVYYPGEDVIELRAQTMEKGGIGEAEYYEKLVGMLESSTLELIRELNE